MELISFKVFWDKPYISFAVSNLFSAENLCKSSHKLLRIA
ncbi:hypothetical protein LSS_21020 [Leptospira santarosai serovar Shermani str. LT 821]|uniref:Uncharacterized protein n=1 Tax=Leptospira santarosai serovar Shermani str. LT 821 TaxID=758847 RepID=A0A097ESB7_9LEPT|nr:hypothetical protein LSS_21020 [Leptospira santarosai serovar Shermani str. LT 821]